MIRGKLFYRKTVGRPNDLERKADLIFWFGDDTVSYNIDEKDETWVWTLREEESAGELSFNKLVETLTGSSPTALMRKTLTAIRKDGWILGPADGGRTFYKQIGKK